MYEMCSSPLHFLVLSVEVDCGQRTVFIHNEFAMDSIVQPQVWNIPPHVCDACSKIQKVGSLLYVRSAMT